MDNKKYTKLNCNESSINDFLIYNRKFYINISHKAKQKKATILHHINQNCTSIIIVSN